MEYITREEAIKLVGEEDVVKAEKDNAEFSHYDYNDTTAISVGKSQYYENDIFNVVVGVCYEHDREIFDATEDLSDLNWEIAGYYVH